MDKKTLFESTVAAESCVAMYKTSGLRNLLLFLLDMLRQVLPLSRINALYCTADADVIVTMSDTNKINVSNKFAVGRHLPPILLRERIGEDVIVDDIRSVIAETKKTDAAFERDMPYLFHNSMLRLPLFHSPTALFLMCFWSKTPHAFDREDLEGIRRLLTPLAEELRYNLSGIELDDRKIVRAAEESGKEKISQCPGLQEVKAQIEAVADVDTTVLILGETGAGKESVADMIHELSPRRSGPFVKVNCGAISPSLVDSELFGHEKGAFTGALSTRQGYFEMADGGTLFLDEIGEMPNSAQMRLLRVLTDGTVRRVGGTKPIPVNVRVIAATQENLMAKLESGRFRQDLWFRLSAYPIHVPPLRRRLSDIPILLNYIIRKKCESLRLPFVPQADKGELNALCRYPWPGNVRELENVVERALLTSKALNRKTLHFDTLIQPAPKRAEETERLIHSEPLASPEEQRVWLSLREHEDEYIAEVIRHCGGKLSGAGGATDILKIQYNTLKARMKKMGLSTRGTGEGRAC
ncbi:sigma-54 interaction domain-containing protein [Mailhella sp.]|uniref:sigma-54 interaction domain-containing protein n=1 Tax=Mailhella sp. TaxID=1981029 RepID=UPI003AB26FD5